MNCGNHLWENWHELSKSPGKIVYTAKCMKFECHAVAHAEVVIREDPHKWQPKE